MKRCTACGETKPLDQFHKRRDAKDGHQSRCRGCKLAQNRRWWSANKDRQRAANARWAEANPEKRQGYSRRWREANRDAGRTSHFKRRYGLTAGDVATLAAKQKHLCLVCGEKMTVPNVDHCHETGRVRGLLCGGCNRGLGQFRDNPKRLRAAADYVERMRAQNG